MHPRPQLPHSQEPKPEVVDGLREGLKSCLQSEEDGSVTMKLKLTDANAIDELVKLMASFSSLIATGGK